MNPRKSVLFTLWRSQNCYLFNTEISFMSYLLGICFSFLWLSKKSFKQMEICFIILFGCFFRFLSHFFFFLQFFSHIEKLPSPVKFCKVWLHSALTDIGQLSLPFLLWHGTSIYFVISEDPWHSYLLASVSSTFVCRGRDSNTRSSAYAAKAFTYCATATTFTVFKRFWCFWVC